mmetsp:Transcript_803/g.1620  ORF Transcript_803/g.1620 Transcript_803/m.1620 type:complete len:254 (+) Transcript_803:1-762(+)
MVQENVSVTEALTAWMGQEVEMANAYKVYAPGGWDDLFYGIEQTNAFLRNLKQCFGDCTPWSMDIFYQQGIGAEMAFHLDRPASCTFCCINRPEAIMTDANGNIVGSLRDPWNCCGGLDFEIDNADGDAELTISSGHCPLGFWCPLPCIPATRDIEMSIVDEESSEEVGTLTKRVPGMFKFLIAPDVDDYHVDFRGVVKPENRALLMAMCMFIDFRYFNDNSRDGTAGGKAREMVCRGGSESGEDGDDDGGAR